MKSESYYEEPLLTLKFNSTISPNKNNFIEVKLLDNSIKKLRVHYSIDNGTTWQISPFQYFSDEMKIQNLGRRVMATVVGDSDNDGQNELVVGYGDRNVYNAAHLSIYEWNETNYSYVETHQMNLPLSPHSIVVGDADNDGSNEIIVGMWSYYLYQFDWDGSSYLKTTIINSYEPYHLYRINGLDIGDLDEDGLNELLVCDISAEHDVYIFKHEAGTYNSIYHSFYNLLGTPGASIGNISNDGLNDFIVGGEFFVRSGNTFESRQNLSYSMGGVKIGDVDADGENEVIRQNIIYRYNANTDLLEEEYSLSPKDAWDCAWLIHLGNFDIDEEFEIVNGRSIDDYNHDGYFEKKWVENNFGDTWGTFVSCGDADNDGFDEFFIGDRNSSWALYDMPIWNSLSNGFFIPATNIETEIKFYFEAVNSSGLFYSNIYSYVTKFPFPIDYSDDFNSPTLDPKWMWHLDSGSQASWSLSANPGHLRISCSGVATNWETGVHDVPYMYQSLPSGDWEIEVKVSEPTSNDQTNGIIVYKSSNEWIMFANDYDSVGEMSLLRANLGGTLDNYAGGDRGNNHPYLKLKKVGTTYSCYGSADGNIWNYYGDLSTSIIFSQMGIFAHSHLGGVSDTINSDFDYFKFTFINEDHTPPSQAIITSPSTGDNVSRIVNINAIAEDNLEGSGIAYVEFWDGVPGVPGFLIGTDHSAPYSISWDSCLAVDGFRDLYIRVYDHTGNYLDSSAVTVTVDNTAPYRANIISPTRWVIVKGNISITADAIDSGTGVDYVEFWDGLPGTGSLIGTDSWAPYSVNWDTTAAGAGPHTLYVRAYDYAGNYLDGNSVGVTVQEIYNYSEELQLLWNTTWGGSNKDYGLGVVVDPNGSIYCTGWTESFGAGGWDSALVKFAPNGTKLWNTTWGGSDRDWLYGVELDSSGFLYCVGYTESFGAGDGDLALVKFAPNGTKLWDTTWGGWGYDCGYKIAIDATGAIYCLGDTLTFGAGGYDFALVKFHPNGTKAWHTTWGDSATDRGSGVAVDANGFIYCVGYTQTPGRGAYEPYDFALVKFAPNGTKLWNTRWGGSDHDWGQSVVVDATGALYCTGITQSFGEGGWDFAFVKFAPNGTKLWNTTWGGSRNDECYGMVADASGAIYCAGQTNSFGTGSWDWALVKFNPNGIKLWDTTWGGSGDDFCREVTVDATGAIYCTGFTPSLGVNRYDLALVKFGFKPLEPPPIITHPSTGDIVSGTITIETNMLEGVKNVTFWLDGIGTGTLLGTDTTSPYSQVWDTTVMGDGSHDLYVRAFDFTGKSSNSSVVTVTVDNTAPTTATITSPSTWDNVSGTTVPIDATAVDVGTGVKNITFWLDGIGTGTLLGTDTAPPYSLNWDTTTTSEGSHDLNVRVFDQAGNYLDSSAVSVVVDNTDPSTATIISPSMGDNLSGTITIDANAIDAGSGVKNVTFWDGLPGIGILLGTDTAFPYSLNWDTTTTSEGSHDLCIQVYDWAGNYLNSIG
ncbi:MAG: SBBP repeat-containing protein [Candidatus Helarchaeota archaeon]|nr:SBBP repeat-containing protein [Candidatus Helarchaeota archaeon]